MTQTLGREVDLLANYPKPKRNIAQRVAEKTEEDRAIARKFGKDFFDGDRKYGYGGYYYHPRFWQPVVPTFQKFYNLTSESKILDVGCGKGFMMYDFTQLIPGITIKGIDISDYAVSNAKEEVRDLIQVANATDLPFEDNSFDLVVSITTIHNLEKEGLTKALKELERVSQKDKFIVIDAYHTEEEKKALFDWVLTAKTMLHVDEWKNLFEKVGYTGDYYWFKP